MIIINADDLGLSNSVNKAILESFNSDFISSTTLLVNMKEPFSQAINYINAGLIPKTSVGIHLNLEQGTPITENIKNINFICNKDGNYSFTFRSKSRFLFDNEIKKIIKEELSQQILLFKNSLLISPSHIDSHNHTHTEFAVLKVILELTNDYNINKVRLSRNIGKGISIKNKIYKLIYNTILKYNVKTTHFFGDFNDYTNINFDPNINYEIMVHPQYNHNNELIELGGELFLNKFQSLFKNQKPGLFSYRDL